jgi:hypothetical protein
VSHLSDITYFAETDFRNQKRKFGIKQPDRTRHMYVIGKTGMGKSALLKNMAIQDVQSDRGMAFMDPHGNLVEELLDFIPEHRVDDVLYVAPFDLAHPISFNVMEDVGFERRHLVANGLMSAFKKIWVDAWSARMEYILNNTLLALLEYPDSTLLGVNRMLADKVYRKRVVGNISDISVRSFWEDEFAAYSDRYMTEAGAAIQNKIGQFISNPLVRNIIGQSRSSFDMRELMDNQKILLINLSKGKVGEDNANLLGSMLITKIYLAAMSRSDVSAQNLLQLPQFYFYVDEFQSFANESFADILSEARKYNLSLTVAHQYIEQMTDEVRAAVFGNIGTTVTFRVGATDAEFLEREFAPTFEATDLVNLGFAQIYLRLMIDGVGSKPFSATTLKPFDLPPQSFADLVIRRSREQYARPRQQVEEQLSIWHQSHGGLIDDPNVIKKINREKEEVKSEVTNYRASRQSLPDQPEPQVPRPNSPKNSKGKSDNTFSKHTNSRSSTAVARPKAKQPEADDKAASNINNTSAKTKKAGSKKSLQDLRSTLAGVLEEAGLEVDKNKSKNEMDEPNATNNKENKKKAKSALKKQTVSGGHTVKKSTKSKAQEMSGSVSTSPESSSSYKSDVSKINNKKSSTGAVNQDGVHQDEKNNEDKNSGSKSQVPPMEINVKPKAFELSKDELKKILEV